MIQTKIQREYIAARSAEEIFGHPCPENLGVDPKKRARRLPSEIFHYCCLYTLVFFFLVSSVRKQCEKVVCSLVSVCFVVVRSSCKSKILICWWYLDNSKFWKFEIIFQTLRFQSLHPVPPGPNVAWIFKIDVDTTDASVF